MMTQPDLPGNSIAGARRLQSDYDVIVAGGGASGLVAAIAAARNGARTLLLEREGCFGGTATTGYVAQYVGFYNGNTQAVWGVPYELTRRVMEGGGSAGFGHYIMGEAAANPITIHHFPFNPEIVKIAADDMAEHDNLDTLFHAQVTGALHREGVVEGVVVETISGRREIRANIVIDCTGDAVVAAAAGVPVLGEEDELRHARQPVTLAFRLSNVDVQRFRAMPREQKRALAMKGLANGELFWESMSFCSTPNGHDAICLMSRITGVDALDDGDVSAAERTGRKQVRSIVGFLTREVPGFERAILSSIASRIGVRETRRIVGQYMLTEEDIMEQRRFDDTIALGCGPMDVHDAIGTGIVLYMPPAPFDIPMRCLLPLETRGLIVSGRAICATREANGGARHMATAMALGQAAGTMAAIAVEKKLMPHEIDAQEVRMRLRSDGAALSIDDCARLSGTL
jgi:ribulose 1,5-bisphosphate synthetase/thiazole synthase